MSDRLSVTEVPHLGQLDHHAPGRGFRYLDRHRRLARGSQAAGRLTEVLARGLLLARGLCDRFPSGPGHAGFQRAVHIHLHEPGNLLPRLISVPAPMRRRVEDDRDFVLCKERADVPIWR